MIQLTAAKCPQCGADIEVNAELEKSICQYCGTTILVQEAIQKIELSGSVKVAGIKNRDDYLEQAKKHYKVGENLEAIENLSYIIAEDSFDIEAYCELIKNDLAILKKENFDLKTSIKNPSYRTDLRDFYDDYLETLERVVKIDDKNEREKYLADVNDDITGIDTQLKEIEERIEKNNKICEKLNEDFNKIKEYGFLDDYKKLIVEFIPTMKDFTSASYRVNKNIDYSSYNLVSYSKITPDGLLYLNYKKSYIDSDSENPTEVELCWEKDTVFLENMNDIDEKFNNYCSKIDSVIEESRIKKEKADKKKEKSRKLSIVKAILGMIGSVLAVVFIVFMNIYEYNAHDDFGYEFVTFVISCILVPYVFMFFIVCIDDIKDAIKEKKKNK